MIQFLSKLRQSGPIRFLRRHLSDRLVNAFYHRPLAILANIYFGFPARRLKVIGVTGTDGKTTTVNLIYHLLTQLGKRAAMVSTVSAVIGENKYDTGFHVTGPPPWQVQKFLRQAVAAKAELMVMEVTSHALDQHRVGGITFYLGVYTNLAGDHLDYHRTLENYLAAKGKLGKAAKKIVLNLTDPNSQTLKDKFLPKKTDVVGYSIDGRGDLVATDLEFLAKETKFSLRFKDQTYQVSLPLLGRFNVENTLAALAAGLALNLPLLDQINSLRSFKAVPGRMETIDQGQSFGAIVDFAHTPNALATVLKFLNQTRKIRKLKDRGKLIVVFGCAGERDKGRRRMGKVAAELADLVVITAEDPRSEGVNRISEEVADWAKQGGALEVSPAELEKKIQTSGHPLLVRIPDRQQAINQAIKLAGPKDTVLVAGKGHEQSMCFGTVEYPWSDPEAVKLALKRIGYG